MDIETVVRVVDVRGTVNGMDKVDSAYKSVGASADSSASSMTKAGASAASAEAAINKLGVQLQANYAQQQQFNEMVSRQSDATKQMVAANDNAAASYRASGIELAEVVNHLRQGAEAAYAFSPAFRGLVNAIAPAALEAAGVAIAAIATGVVTATNYTGTGLIALAGAAEKLSPSFLGVSSSIRSAGIALETFNPVLAGVATSIFGVAGAIVSRFLPVIGQLLLVYDAIKLVGEAWTLGAQKLQQYVDLSVKAASLGVSTDFLQRLTKSAEDAKIPIDTLTASLTKMQDALAPKLGGSDAIQQIDKLASYGNFKGNTGIAQIKQATDPEQQFAAVIDFYKQATAASEKLAALDVVKTIFGPDVAKNLARDDEYLANIQQKMKDVAATDLVKQADIDRAVALQIQYNAAVTLLEQRWHPIQDLLTQGGILMQTAWVNIVSAVAAAFDWVVKLVGMLQPLLQYLPTFATALTAAFTAALGPFGAIIQGFQQIGKYLFAGPAGGDQMGAARNQLSSGLSNPANVAAARQQTLTMSEQLRPDKSKAKAPDTEDTGAYDRASEQLLKYIEVTKAAAASVDAGVYQQERLKAIAELTAAGLKDGLTPAAAAAKAEMSGLADQAAAAALALAKAKVESQISFGAKTSLLSQQDVQIATQLKGIYPDVATALGSVEAQAMRTNTAMKEISSSIETNLTSGLTDIVSGTKSASQGFSDMANAIAKAIEQMVIKIMIVEPLMRSLQASISGSGILNFLGGSSSTGGAATSTGAAGVGGIGGLYHTGGIVGSEPTSMRYVHPAYFNDNTPRFHGGGIAGDEVPIIAKKGEGVFTAGQMAAMGSRAAPVVNVTLIESPNGGGTVKQTQNSNGGIDIEVAIAQISAKSAATPGAPLNRVMTDQLGARQRLASR